jgi:dolichyl-phosphate-mannose--protein O-mannosyl transferase
MVIITKVDSNLHYHLVSPQIQRKNKNYEMSTNSDISTGEVKEESPLLKSTHSGNLNIIYA